MSHSRLMGRIQRYVGMGHCHCTEHDIGPDASKGRRLKERREWTREADHGGLAPACGRNHVAHKSYSQLLASSQKLTGLGARGRLRPRLGLVRESVLFAGV